MGERAELREGDRIIWRRNWFSQMYEACVDEVSPSGRVKLNGVWNNRSDFEVIEHLPGATK